MRFIIALWIAKIVAVLINIIDKKRGTNYSGELAIKLCPNFIRKVKGIDLDKTIMVTGTNGKSTTTNLISYTINSSGKKVATNKEGANMVGGVATTLIKNSSILGKFKKEFLILEIDERSLMAIHKNLPAKHLVITNLQKDQVQRNGDPNYIYSKFAKTINKEMTIYLNNEEPRSKGLEDFAGNSIYYGVEKNSRTYEKNDFYDVTLPCPKCNYPIKYLQYNLENIGKFECTNCEHKSVEEPNVFITNVDFENKVFIFNNKEYKITYNTPFYIYNYAATIAVAKNFGIEDEQIQNAFENFVNPLERREVLKYKNKEIKYLRMKQENPETLQSALDTISLDKTPKAVLIGLYEIKDFYPFYTNTFYFFDCNFNKIAQTDVEKYIVFSKSVCYDAANRMVYAGAEKEKIIVLDKEDNIEEIIKHLDDIKTDNIYMITGMWPYKKIKAYLDIAG